MKKFNWKLALKKRWLELLVAVVWLTSAIVNFFHYSANGDEATLVVAICAVLCVPCWVYIFYKRAKRDGA